jgi:hypothetical protein
VTDERSLKEPITDDFVVALSGTRDKAEPEQTVQQRAADERRTAWACLKLGIAYNWRDIGDGYAAIALEMLATGTLTARHDGDPLDGGYRSGGQQRGRLVRAAI